MGCCIHESGLFIVTEFVAGGDLRKLLKGDAELHWTTRFKIALDICYALCFLHSKHVLHRDLKSKNVLIEEGSYKAKVCDFGFAREYNTLDKNQNMVTFKVGTDTWMAPEVLMGQNYDSAADVYSFGIVLFEMLTREKPPKRRPADAYNFIGTEFVDMIKEKTTISSPNAQLEVLTKLAVECSQNVPDKRPNFTTVLKQMESVAKSNDETKS